MSSSAGRLDDVEFLVRSANRIDVLDAVRATSVSRQELLETTDFSRITLSRILGDLEDRGWVQRQNGTYETTPEGEIVTAEVERLFANLAALDTLGETVQWLPVDRFDFELARFDGAEVMVPNGHDLTAQIRWVGQHIGDANAIRSVATWVASDVLETIVELTVDGRCTFEGIAEGHVIDYVQGDPELRAVVRSLLDADAATLYRYDGPDAAVTMSILPDGVLLCGRQDSGSFPEAVATTDAAIVSWAETHFESLREQSVRLDAESFTA